jgi:hypothetical protein
MRRFAPLGAGAARLGARGGVDPTAIHQALRQARQKRRDRCEAPHAGAAAIGAAMSRPGMGFVPVKRAEDQAGLMLLRVRGLLVKSARC